MSITSFRETTPKELVEQPSKGCVCFKRMFRLRRRASSKMTTSKKLSRQSFKVCFCFKRMFRLRTAEPPDEIRHLFDVYSSDGTMSIENLCDFLANFQGETHAMDRAKFIFDSLRHLKIFQRKGLHLDAFFRYLMMGDLNGPLGPPEVHHDMNAPLAHYFIFTGHNSYLTGNQVTSDSSTVPIIDSLNKGVRVIELDLWPNAREDDIEVRHGGTLTAPVPLQDCLIAIRDNAFHDQSKYPVIITFEDHITQRLQAKVAKMVDEILGPMLYRPPPHPLVEFPSPESLKEKILISTKPPESPETKARGNPLNLPKLQSSDGEQSYSHEDEEEQDVTDDDSSQSDDYDDNSDNGDSEKESALGYKDLIAIHAGKPKGGFEHWFTDHGHARRLSLSEQELEDISKIQRNDIVRFTQKNLLRIYPKGVRLDSSNYPPMTGWMHGAQMVAFNMQGHGKYLRMMEGMFRANGGCGYVKKPEIMLTIGPNGEVFDPLDLTRPVKTTLKVVVYMGEGWHEDFRSTHFDRYSPPDFFVKVGIVGVPADSIIKRTRVIEDEWMPVWDEEFTFRLTIPELAILRIETLEYDASGYHDFGGQICLPVSEIRAGIRVVRLSNRRGELYRSVKLLMHFERYSNNA